MIWKHEDNWLRRKYFHRCRFKKGGSSTTVQSYQPTAEEKRLWQQQADYTDAVAPNALALNDQAMELLRDSLGTVQVDYNTMNQNAQNQISGAMGSMAGLAGSNTASAAAANNVLGALGSGNVPVGYQQNMENSIRSALDNTLGKTVNNLSGRGVLNSSVTNEALNDIERNAANSVAEQYQQNLGTAAQMAQQQFENTQNANSQNSGIYSNLINSATAPITTAATAQDAAITPAQALWNTSLGLNGAGTSALGVMGGKGTTTSTQTYNTGGGGLFSGLLGGVASGYANAFGGGLFCFTGNTMISMADGTEKAIKDIETDDVVATDDGGEAVVTEVMKPHHNEVYEVTCENGSVKTTASQPLMQANGYDYIFVGDLEKGMELRRAGKVLGVKPIGVRKVYDFKTSGDNHYIANNFVAMGGDGEIWGR